ncbi:hypothetical protein J2X77_004892 [Sphingobacterium sp. 2149]|nr:hypothetical protein [Sphingobacterium sp. 2149]
MSSFKLLDFLGHLHGYKILCDEVIRFHFIVNYYNT